MSTAGGLASTFKYGFIPVDLTSSIKIQDASTEGGLERDALRLAAEAHFAAATSTEFREQQDKIMNDYLVSRGGTAGSFPGLSSAVEIVVLQLPTRDNGYIGVSMYCDQNGKLKNFELNTRATSLVQACGHANQIFGDTFIGRYYDNEEFPWERRDFDYSDMNSDATWVAEAYKRNQGRPSGAYSTSTVLQNMLNSNNTAVINDKAEPTRMARTAFTDDAVIDDHITWSQTGEEVELKLTLPTETKKTDLAVKIQPKRLQIVVKSDPSLADTNPVFGAGAALWGNIDSDCSAWTIEKSSTGKVVVVFTLAKANSVEWPKVFA